MTSFESTNSILNQLDTDFRNLDLQPDFSNIENYVQYRQKRNDWLCQKYMMLWRQGAIKDINLDVLYNEKDIPKLEIGQSSVV